MQLAKVVCLANGRCRILIDMKNRPPSIVSRSAVRYGWKARQGSYEWLGRNGAVVGEERWVTEHMVQDAPPNMQYQLRVITNRVTEGQMTMKRI